MADPNGFHSDSDDESLIGFPPSSSDVTFGSTDVADMTLAELEKTLGDVTAAIDARRGIQAVENDSLSSVEATWRETEQRLAELAAKMAPHQTVERAHKAVKRLATAEEKGKELGSIHTLPAEKKLYAAVEALKATPLHRQELKEIIGASPRKSQIVRAQFIIKPQESTVPGSQARTLYSEKVKSIIVCTDTTFQEIVDAEPSDKLGKAFDRYGRMFSGAGASFTEGRRVRKDKRFIAKVANLSQKVIDTKFQYTDSKNRIERRDFPLGRKYRNDVILSFVWLGA